MGLWVYPQNYVQHLWPASECLEGLIWCKDHTKSCVCMNLWDQKKEWRWVRNETPAGESDIQSPRHGARQSTLRSGAGAVKARMLSLAARKKDTEPNFTFSHFAVLDLWVFFSSFRPLLLLLLLFVQPVKYPLGLVWEETMGSIPLDK